MHGLHHGCHPEPARRAVSKGLAVAVAVRPANDNDHSEIPPPRCAGVGMTALSTHSHQGRGTDQGIRVLALTAALVALVAGALHAAAPTTSGAKSNAAAFVRVSPRDPRYFELSNGRPYIPIGLNMIAPWPGTGWPQMDDWMNRLAAERGNFIRVWLAAPFFDVEHAKCGEYDAEKAKRIDLLLAAARDRGIRVKMCCESFRQLIEPGKEWTAKPLHHVSKGGTAESIVDFFDGEPSRTQFKKKLAWYAARYGDSPTVFGWELWNEINAVRGGNVMAWTEVMLPELHRLFPKNLAMQSLGSFDRDSARAMNRRLAVMPGNDVAQVHRYLDLGAALEVCKGPVDVLAADAVKELLAADPKRPVLLAESGAVEPRHTGPFKLYAKDKDGVILHDVLFAPFFAGAAGPGHIWHWDHYVAKYNLWWHFGRFAAVVENLDPPAEGFKILAPEHPGLRVRILAGRRTTLAWLRDPGSTWQTELADGKPPARLTGQTLALPAEAGDLAGAKIRTYDPWTGQWASASLNGRTVRLPEFARSIVVRIDRP